LPGQTRGVISARVDYPLVAQLVDILRASNHDPWFDHQLVVGRDWKEQLQRQLCDATSFSTR
jgi:hypothetical protein